MPTERAEQFNDPDYLHSDKVQEQKVVTAGKENLQEQQVRGMVAVLLRANGVTPENGKKLHLILEDLMHPENTRRAIQVELGEESEEGTPFLVSFGEPEF